MLISPFSRHPWKGILSLGVYLLPPRGLQAEPWSATRAARGLKWGLFGAQISIKFEFVLDFFALEARSGPEDAPNRPSEPKIEKNAIGGTKNDRESDAKH